MNIADRIQQLRKAKGISQEELADKLGVSRQAVSKWESEQSTPDVEKIILLSEYFEVTTDYLMKGIEAEQTETCDTLNSNLFTITGTALNFIGLVAAAMVWYEEQTALAAGVGLILMAVGCMVFGIGMIKGDTVTKVKAKKYFGMINIWIFGLMLIFIFNTILRKNFKFSNLFFVSKEVFWIVYFVICITVDIIVYKKGKNIK